MLTIAETVTQQNHDLLWAAVVTAGLAFLGTMLVAILANQNRKTARNVAQEILDALDTGNAHTAGQSLARLEDMAWRHENRLDAIEVRLTEGQETFEEIEEQRLAAEGRLEEIHSEHVMTAEQLVRLHEEHVSTRTQVREVQETLDNHVEDVTPLVEWTRQQMEEAE